MTKFNCQTLAQRAAVEAERQWTPHGAIAELVDNSFGPMRGNANKVIISFDRKARTIEVLDDGQGMDHIGRSCFRAAIPLVVRSAILANMVLAVVLLCCGLRPRLRPGRCVVMAE
jgi:hypothetical protein